MKLAGFEKTLSKEREECKREIKYLEEELKNKEEESETLINKRKSEYKKKRKNEQYANKEVFKDTQSQLVPGVSEINL